METSKYYSNTQKLWKSSSRKLPTHNLTSVPCKLMERLIRYKLLDHMRQNNFFSPFQHGFIPGKSCVTQLLETLDEITDAIEQGYNVNIIYLDFCKAFDKIPHRRLMKKLWAYGIRGKVYKCIKEFLSNRIQRVVVNGATQTLRR